MGIFRTIKPFKDQDFSKLKSSCLSSGELYLDKEFPPVDQSLFFSNNAPDNIEWKRPGELTQDPKLFIDGASAGDFSQGELGNCWFVAACSCIAGIPKLWKQVVPEYEKQEWGGKNKYAGIFHFQFYRFGIWYDVVIDDYLPTRNGRLLYIHSPSRNEFWSALLEKAYAKLFGDYESLTAGKAKDALVDMLGGLGQVISVKDLVSEEEKHTLFEHMLEAYENHSVMTASISASEAEREAKLECGLIKGHAYSVTMVKRIKQGTGISAFFKNEKLDMIRLRNPWGEKEWTGAWSDGSAEWQKVSGGEKKDVGLVFSDDGEFWMEFHDFIKYYTSMDICHMINTSLFSFKKTWHENMTTGQWSVTGHRAGGCGNHKTFLDNPQYVFDIEEDTGEVILSLEQEDMRIYRDTGKENLTIGFAVHKADLNRTCRMHDKLDRVHVSSYSQSRSVFERLKFKRGRYVVIPSTFDPNVEGNYMLRLYCDKDADLRELTSDQPIATGLFKCCADKYKVASQVTIINCKGLEKQDIRSGADPYCIVKCEGKEHRTPICFDTINPEWDCRLTFYKKSPKADVVIEVWNYNLIRDEFMGMVRILGISGKSTKEGVQQLNLLGRKKENNVMKPGRLSIELKTFPDLTHA